MKRLALLLIGCTAPATYDEATQATTTCGASPVDTRAHGMDVSKYETSIDWPTAKAAGIDFAFIRVSDGLNYPDPKFATYWKGAADAGVMRGAYQFFRPDQDPIAQADYLLAHLGPHTDLDLPPALDVETTDGLEPAQVAAAVRTWVDHVTLAIGRSPIIYAGYYSWQDYTGNLNMTSAPLWHAQYTSAACPNIPTPWTSWSFWQYTSEGSVPSVLGELTDLDVFDGTVDDLRAFAAMPPAACATLPADGGEIDDADACFSDGGPATTLRHVTDAGERGGLVWTHATASDLPGNFATWTITLAEAGRYRLEAYTAAAYAESTAARYRVRANTVESDVAIDQSAVDGWQSLGAFAFAAGGDQWVQLDDNTGESGQTKLVFDAIRLVRLDPTTPPITDPDPVAPETSDSSGCAAGGTPSLFVALALGLIRRRKAR